VSEQNNMAATQVLDKEARFKMSVHRDVDNMLKSIVNIQNAFTTFYNVGWKPLKTPGIMLLPTYAERHQKSYKQMVDVAVYYLANNHFFNMCIRMAEISVQHSGGEHQQATAKYQAMLKAFVRVQNSVLFRDNAKDLFEAACKAVAKKSKGFEAHLVELNEMVEAVRGLILLIQESFTLLTKAQAVTYLVNDMIDYYKKINDEAEEAILA
jgi:hypothetical protein